MGGGLRRALCQCHTYCSSHLLSSLQPPGRLLLKLIDKIKEEDKIEIEIYRGLNPKLNEYGINASPAVVIDKDIRIIGVCPSEEILKEALREAGM